jgi:S-adenosylmethionine:tRNA ribosyltransferase-isomerase
MKPATLPSPSPDAARLLLVDPTRGRYAHHRVQNLADVLFPGDLLVVNDAATLPASIAIRGRDIEIRLARRKGSDTDWVAVLFGRGDFRTPTEERPDPAHVRPGERLDLGSGLTALVTHVDDELPRLVEIHFETSGAALFQALYRQARPVQYAYLERELPLWHFQNRFAARPWALEMPSAGQSLTWELLSKLRARGVTLASITHAAGISSTGSAALDRRFPLPERYEIGSDVVQALGAARERGGRVLAVGTTVVRALESRYAEQGRLVPGEGEARLVIGPGFRPAVVDGILSGMHERGTSHFALLEAFAPRTLLGEALEDAERTDYRQHEFGDAMLILGS